MEDFEKRKQLLDTLYKDRINFTIVAVTGYTGTGCSSLAKLMSKDFLQWDGLRKPEDLVVVPPPTTDSEELYIAGKSNHQTIASTIFSRKYSICYNFLAEEYKPFVVIKYSYALLFYALSFFVSRISHDKNLKELAEDKIDARKSELGSDLKNKLCDLLKDKFCPSRDAVDDNYRREREDKGKKHNLESFTSDTEGNGYYFWEKIHGLAQISFQKWDELFKSFYILDTPPNDSDERRRNIAMSDLFFGQTGVFLKFANDFLDLLWTTDPYCTNYFFHRLGAVVRATGDPLRSAEKIFESNIPFGEHLYEVVTLINRIIKGYRRNNTSTFKAEAKTDACRIVIDKLRNSLEAKYLKERYSAFYFIALHEEKAVPVHLENRIEAIYPTEDLIQVNKGLTKLQLTKILALDTIERDGKSFERGKFFAPNLSQCVADAEIHISNEEQLGGDRSFFFSMAEQWMKYASLIQHPGLITPSSEERCMVVAYTAKFNSGCLSRQVGAVITNKAHTIRSIGWNDVPYGQLPCLLREVPVMALQKHDKTGMRRFVYSEYEIGSTKRFKDGQTFNTKTRLKFKSLHLGLPNNPLMKGLPYSYCFKKLQNDFEQEKNQVHTRSLHAEENAILQMAKYGGEALVNGIIYVTASPCELCCKKLYQIGVRKIVYIDEYPGISRENIIANGFHRPRLKQFQGAYGTTYIKLYQPFLSYKDEQSIRKASSNGQTLKDNNASLIDALSKKYGVDLSVKKGDQAELEVLINKLSDAVIKKGE
ncbi:MAG: hypothetical protein K2L93_00560 [Muribaculaceae bacterium]|nr:hypothetical protein [Muribaculaceae bacterium]